MARLSGDLEVIVKVVGRQVPGRYRGPLFSQGNARGRQAASASAVIEAVAKKYWALDCNHASRKQNEAQPNLVLKVDLKLQGEVDFKGQVGRRELNPGLPPHISETACHGKRACAVHYVRVLIPDFKQICTVDSDESTYESAPRPWPGGRVSGIGYRVSGLEVLPHYVPRTTYGGDWGTVGPRSLPTKSVGDRTSALSRLFVPGSSVHAGSRKAPGEV
ncbi:hypothetical protein C8R44DRAFT_724647 [Mycena epipterygia]|nr:hypothetical protein C8R44DRAFT_724647 [Mycena epipterygia]